MRRASLAALAAGALLAAYGVVAVVLLWLAFAPGSSGTNVGVVGSGVAGLQVLLPPTAFALVGAVLVARLPTNLVGWALAAYGLNFAGTIFSESYVELSSSKAAPLWGWEVAAWFQTYNWALGLIVLTNLLLHFPSGSLPSPGWRWPRRLSLALAVAVVVAWVDIWSVRHAPSLIEDSSAFPPLARSIQTVAEIPVMLLVLVGLVSLAVRFRRAGHVERLQVKWLFLAVAVAAGGIVSFTVVGSGPGRGAPWVAELLALIGLSGIPVAIGVAVLRYRLFDIDRIISRTLGYALVTAVLVGVYAAGVLGVGALVPAGSSDLLVAGSTLAVAALFQPVRARVQHVVDRRFNRSRYDAQAEVSEFAGRLRDRVDLTALVDELEDVVAATVAPTTVSLWLAPAGARP